MSLRLFAMALSCSLLACESDARAIRTTEEAIRVSDRFVIKEFPEARLKILDKVVRDSGETWVVEYRLPEGYAGGAPIIEIDKSSGRIVKAYSEQ